MEVESAGTVLLADEWPRTRAARDLIACIRETNELLHAEADLSPANHRAASLIRRLSLQLRSSLLPEEVLSVLGDEYVRKHRRDLQRKLSEAEFLVEMSDSHQLCVSPDPVMDIVRGLPYWNAYINLVSEELSMLRRLTELDQADRTTVVFVGSGPMPLSPILLHLLGRVEVICLEIDPAAYRASRALLERMELANKVRVLLVDGAAFDYSAYNQVFVASLVDNKAAVLERIRLTSPAPLAAVRTAAGIKQVMYEAIDESELMERGWRMLSCTSPDDTLVMNSTLFIDRAASSRTDRA